MQKMPCFWAEVEKACRDLATLYSDITKSRDIIIARD
jgi:hypothetical protein